MAWYERHGQRVWGEGGYALALVAHGWTPADDDVEPEPDGVAVEVTIGHTAYADLTDDEQADVEAAIADETPPVTPVRTPWDD